MHELEGTLSSAPGPDDGEGGISFREVLIKSSREKLDSSSKLDLKLEVHLLTLRPQTAR
jgi:hypothetical protein